MKSNYNAFVDSYNNFDYRPLKGSTLTDFYVDDFTKEITDRIISTIKITDRFRKILIIGHTGCGKSTILNKISEELKNSFYVVDFSVANELNMMDIETIDILMTIYLQLVNSVKNMEENKLKTVTSSFSNLMKSFVKKINIKEFETSFKLLETISLKIKVEPESRNAMRDTFKNQIESVQKNLSEACSYISNLTGKDILIVIDDLDKLKDANATKKIFFNETHLLTMPEAKIVFTFPIFAYYSAAFVHISDKFSQEFIQLVNLCDFDGNFQKDSYSVLKKLIHKRINHSIISEKALNELIEKSGGLLRDLVKFMQDACKIAIDKRLMIINSDVAKKVIREKINEYYRLFDFTKRENDLLEIMETQQRDSISKDVLVFFLRYLFVLKYGNQGDVTWYDAHPCLKECFIRK